MTGGVLLEKTRAANVGSHPFIQRVLEDLGRKLESNERLRRALYEMETGSGCAAEEAAYAAAIVIREEAEADEMEAGEALMECENGSP